MASPTEAFASFNAMREAGELTDVALVFGNERVRCHKVVLAASSDYFRGMFLADMSESKAEEVPMHGIDAPTGRLLVEYLYANNITITPDNAQGLLEAAEMLLLLDLKQSAEEFLCGSVGPDNCVTSLNLARLYTLPKLEEAANSFIQSNVNAMLESEELGQLPQDDLVYLLRSHERHEESFRLLQRWVRAAEGRDATCLIDMLKHIRLSSCSQEFILNEVMEEEMLACPRGVQLIQAALKKSLRESPLAHQHQTRDLPQAQHPQRTLFVGDWKSNMWLCDDNTNWQPMADKPFQLELYSACASPNGFIVTGGSEGDIQQRNCYEYMAREKRWRTLPPFKKARLQHASICHDQFLFILGGCTGWDALDSPLDSVERLDFHLLQWSTLPPMPRALVDPLTAIASNGIFVIGGYGVSPVRDVSFFSFEQRTWQPRSPIPEDCAGASAVFLNEKIFVVGGYKRICYAYDPRTDGWMQLQSPQSEHHYGTAFVLNERIVLCGGSNTTDIEEYDVERDRWMTWELKMPTSEYMRFALSI